MAGWMDLGHFIEYFDCFLLTPTLIIIIYTFYKCTINYFIILYNIHDHAVQLVTVFKVSNNRLLHEWIKTPGVTFKMGTSRMGISTELCH